MRYVIILAIILVSCKPTKQVEQVKDSCRVVYVEKLKDTTIFVATEIEEGIIKAMVQCDSERVAFMDSLIFYNKNQQFQVVVKNGMLNIRFSNLLDSLRIRIKYLEVYNSTYKEITKNQTKIVEVVKKNPINSFFIKAFFLQLLIIILYICFKFKVWKFLG